MSLGIVRRDAAPHPPPCDCERCWRPAVSGDFDADAERDRAADRRDEQSMGVDRYGSRSTDPYEARRER